jgi:hypothetical protein
MSIWGASSVLAQSSGVVIRVPDQNAILSQKTEDQRRLAYFRFHKGEKRSLLGGISQCCVADQLKRGPPLFAANPEQKRSTCEWRTGNLGERFLE